MEDRCTKLLPVVVGDATLKAKSEVVNHYMKSYIKLEWSGKFFWKNLKYSMPDCSVQDGTEEHNDNICEMTHNLIYNDTALLL